MNTNKAPDKIYVDKFGQSIKGYIPEGCSLVTEYIRKDALLEWAEEEMMKAARSSEAYGRRNAFMDVIDKLNEM